MGFREDMEFHLPFASGISPKGCELRTGAAFFMKNYRVFIGYL
jgi:hypothetical protein